MAFGVLVFMPLKGPFTLEPPSAMVLTLTSGLLGAVQIVLTFLS